jgi:hypothetical protein
VGKGVREPIGSAVGLDITLKIRVFFFMGDLLPFIRISPEV